MMDKGTIVLVPFPFTDLSSKKVRPAVVVSNVDIEDDVILAFITSNTNTASKCEVLIQEKDKYFEKSGLKTTSAVRLDKLATLEKEIILGKLGELHPSYLEEVDKNIQKVFGIN
jgi:mRNA interferase MazF